MANVNSLTSASSAASSLYGSRNILSGLASGLDTEAMIENSISGYKTKITQLEQSQTKIEWKQDAYREIISLAANMNTKYSSYTSSTNLSSASFFDGAAVTSTLGTYANMVSAQGTTSSNIKINSVTRMASSASYSVSLPSLSAAQGEEQEETTLATKLSDLSISLTNGTINGVEINFTDTLTSESTIQDVLKAINNSNAGITASYSKLTNQVYFTTNDTGSDQKIEFDGDMLSDLFGTPVEGDEGYSAGSDAVLSIKVNGQTIEEYTSKSNNIDMDGMKVT
ncbi:MAG: hypothetical protein IJT94_17825, partial [Oscillibacter sp.]|nr:hypothetical protein [Oscillibacter sp.]